MATLVLRVAGTGIAVKVNLWCITPSIILIVIICAVSGTARAVGVAPLQSVLQIRNGCAACLGKSLASVVKRVAGVRAEIPGAALLRAVAVNFAGAVRVFFDAGLLVRAIVVFARNCVLAAYYLRLAECFRTVARARAVIKRRFQHPVRVN